MDRDVMAGDSNNSLLSPVVFLVDNGTEMSMTSLSDSTRTISELSTTGSSVISDLHPKATGSKSRMYMEEDIVSMRSEMERLSQQNAALTRKVSELEKRGHSQSSSDALDSILKNIEASERLEERLGVLSSVIQKIEGKTQEAVLKCNLRSQSRNNLEEGSEIVDFHNEIKLLSTAFISFKDRYENAMDFLESDLDKIVSRLQMVESRSTPDKLTMSSFAPLEELRELENHLMSRWRVQEDALEAMKRRMEGDKQQFSQSLAIKDEVLLKVSHLHVNFYSKPT